jgi:hypothetical protein
VELGAVSPAPSLSPTPNAAFEVERSGAPVSSPNNSELDTSEFDGSELDEPELADD